VFIEKHQAEFSIKAICRVLQVARNSWYVRRQQFRLVCDNVVREAFSDAKQRYGTPRLTDELRAQGRVYNIKTVAASLRRQV
ncbi:IS3 family transposase, partial [Salmonella enterica subsp. enterica serovar Enteritidis]|nr:IS3 family transposase [Salmonella enterica subsp. enterica serovar Enteritidis]